MSAATDGQGCPGQYLPKRGHTAALCFTCARYSALGGPIKPSAAYSPEVGAWDCPDREPLQVEPVQASE